MTSIYQTLLATGNYCIYNTSIAKRIGRNEAITLGIMCTLSSAYGNDWFPCPAPMLMGALSFKSKHTVLTIVDNLVSMGIVDKCIDERHNESYYRIDQEKLESLFDGEKVDPLDLLASSSYQIYNISIADHFGDNIVAVVFATLTSYSRAYADAKNGWFTAPEEKIAEEVCIKKRNIVREAICRLVDEGFIETKKEGIPCRKYYRFVSEKLTGFLKKLEQDGGVQKGSNLLVQLCTEGCKKVPTIYINSLFSSLRSKKRHGHFQESVSNGEENNVVGQEKMVGLIPEEVMNEYASAEELKQCDRLFKKFGFSHRMPKEGEAPTKLLKEVIEDLRDIASGKFLDWQFDPDWANRNLDTTRMDQCHAECHTFSDAVDAVIDTFDDYVKARDDISYFPIDKFTLPNRCNNYLYNRRMGKSWFLQFMCMGAQTREGATEDEYYPKIPKTFKRIVSDMNLDWDLKKIAKNVCMMSEWHRRTRGVLSRKTEYDWLTDEEDFWNSYLTVLVDMIGNEQPRRGHFTVYGPTHYNWMDVMADRYGTDFNVLRKCKDEKERGYNR